MGPTRVSVSVTCYAEGDFLVGFSPTFPAHTGAGVHYIFFTSSPSQERIKIYIPKKKKTGQVRGELAHRGFRTNLQDPVTYGYEHKDATPGMCEGDATPSAT
ncbi:hypothetical protein EVAR_60868_1 [Eumeta japonica]|uniref:Uncharacterized protein n=1 Tax=Eumeta variegata TaxID=151549 RepID=A0A4C1Y8W4_EUMVA|nr:hypothetical protein EVAR_60868_1 [Eumeta japonica]